MSLFGKIFSNNDSKDTSSSNIIWNDLTQLQQLDEIADESANIPVLIFKHSTRCPISRMALKNFEREYDIEDGTLKIYYLDLLEHRDISDAIASRFDILHQSPQILVIKKGQAIYHASHSDIDAVIVKQKIDNA